MISRTTLEAMGLALSIGMAITGCGLSQDPDLTADDNAASYDNIGRLGANSVTIADLNGAAVQTGYLGADGEPILPNIQLDYEVRASLINDNALAFDVKVSSSALPQDIYSTVIMEDLFGTSEAGALVKDVTIDLSEAVSGTSLQCEQAGAHQSSPWSTASAQIRRIDYDNNGSYDGDKLSIKLVFGAQLALNTGSGCQPSFYNITSRGIVFFDEPIFVNSKFVQERTNCSEGGDTCQANRPACLSDAFGAANEQGVIANPNDERARRDFFGRDPQCWEPAGTFKSCGALLDEKFPQDALGLVFNPETELHCVFDDQAPFVADYTNAGWIRLDSPGNRTYDCQACFYRTLP